MLVTSPHAEYCIFYSCCMLVMFTAICIEMRAFSSTKKASTAGCCRLLQAAAGCCRLLIRVQRLLALAAHAAGPAAASSSRYELLMDLLLCLLRPRRWPSALERQSRGLRKSLEADFSSVFGSNSGSMMKYTSTSLNSASSHSEVKASN